MSDHNPIFDQVGNMTENLVSNIQGGVIICQYDPAAQTSKTIYMSEGWSKLTGYSLDDLNTRFGGNPQALVIPEDAESASLSYAEQMSRGNCYQLEYRFRHKDGHLVWAIDRGIITATAEGLNQNQSIITDITPMKENEEKLRRSEMRFRIATKAAHAAVFEFDLRENRYLHIENAQDIFGVDAQNLITALTVASLRLQSFGFTDALRLWYHPDDIPLLLHAREELLHSGGSECEVRIHRSDGAYLWCRLVQTLVQDEAGKPLRSIGYLSDVDEQHQRTQRLLLEAQSDALTGLLNKGAIRGRGEQLLGSTPHLCHALLVLDVDNFKSVNDGLGHLFGDAVLMDVSAKLRRLFRHDSLIGRIGGDEFVMLLRGDISEAIALRRAEEICRAFRRTYVGEKRDYSISCSVGIALSVPGDTFESLFHKADVALYRAKAHGKDCFVLFSEGEGSDRNELLGDLSINGDEPGDSGRLQIKERIFELLYGSVDFSSSVNMVLALLGQLLDLSRVYIFENSADGRISSCIYEWCAEGIPPMQAQMQALPVGELSYFTQFDSNGIFRCMDTSVLPLPLRALYEKTGMRATFQVSILEEGIVRGLMGFDRQDKALGQSSDLVDLMGFAAKITGTFIIKKRADESICLYNQNKMEALDCLPCAIYVIDEDYRLYYMNNTVLDLCPNVLPGQKCHDVFMHNSTPCPNCPAMRCQDGGPYSTEIYNPHTKLWLLSTASCIRWSDQENMRLVCCQVINQYKKQVPSTEVNPKS